MQLAHVTGVESVIKKLRATHPPLVKKARIGCKRAGLVLQAASQKICPVQFGNLKASAFTRDVSTLNNVDVIVGYTATYAVYVHENLNAKHGKEFNMAYSEQISRGGSSKNKKRHRTWFNRGENQQAKFLEKPAREMRAELLAIIYSSVKM